MSEDRECFQKISKPIKTRLWWSLFKERYLDADEVCGLCWVSKRNDWTSMIAEENWAKLHKRKKGAKWEIEGADEIQYMDQSSNLTKEIMYRKTFTVI